MYFEQVKEDFIFKIFFVLIFISCSLRADDFSINSLQISFTNLPYKNNSEERRINSIMDFIGKKVIPALSTKEYGVLYQSKIEISFSTHFFRDGIHKKISQFVHKIEINDENIFSDSIYALIAHELFHVIQSELRPHEYDWVNEGLAQLFEYITTRNFNRVSILGLLQNSKISLTSTFDINAENINLYGHTFLYFYYLYSHCGREDLLHLLLKNDSGLIGKANISAALHSLNLEIPECRDFTSSFIAFEIARFHNHNSYENDEILSTYSLVPFNLSSKDEEKINFPLLPDSAGAFTMEYFMKNKNAFIKYAVYFAQQVFPFQVSSLFPLGNSSEYKVIAINLTAD